VIQRKFDFRHLAESALLDDFEIVTRASTTQSSSLKSPPPHHLVAAAASAQRTCHTTAQTSHRNIAYIEPIPKHVYVMYTSLRGCRIN